MFSRNSNPRPYCRPEVSKSGKLLASGPKSAHTIFQDASFLQRSCLSFLDGLLISNILVIYIFWSVSKSQQTFFCQRSIPFRTKNLHGLPCGRHHLGLPAAKGDPSTVLAQSGFLEAQKKATEMVARGEQTWKTGQMNQLEFDTWFSHKKCIEISCFPCLMRVPTQRWANDGPLVNFTWQQSGRASQAVTSLSFSCDETYLATLGGQDWGVFGQKGSDSKHQFLETIHVNILKWFKMNEIGDRPTLASFHGTISGPKKH